MKVGASFSRCLRDIFEKRVDIKDVLVIIARTDFTPHDDEQWQRIWEGYLWGGMSNPEWTGLDAHEEEMRNLAIQLYDGGKLHQPRQFKAHPHRLTEYWYDVILSEEVVNTNPAVKKAWDNYQMIAGLS
jgi:hypothetical protein